MMNLIKALLTIMVLILLKYIHIKLIKNQIRSHLDSINAKDIVVKFEKMEYRYDIYHAIYELDSEVIKKHIVYSLFSGIRWL